MAKQGDSQQTKPIVLIVEDERDLRDIYALKFKKEGYAVFEAGDGEEALKLLNGQMPALILLDLIMPRMGGYQFLQILRAKKEYKSTPVFILSNLSQDHEITEGLRLKANKYLIKAHYTPEEIVEKVNEFLHKNG